MSKVTRRGISLARRGVGTTLILETIAGVTFVNKLGAICIFEADFNYLTKLVFAQKMTKKDCEKDIIPDKVYANKDSHSDDAAMTKVFL